MAKAWSRHKSASRGRRDRAGRLDREAVPGSDRAPRRRSLGRRIMRQSLAAGIIFLVVLGIHSLPFATARRAEDGIRWLLNLRVDLSPVTRAVQGLLRRGAVAPAAPEGQGSSPGAPAAAPEGQAGPRPGTLKLPASGSITSGFGWREPPGGGEQELHEGVDIGAPAGSEVQAATDGTVTQVRQDQEYGWVVEVDHGGGLSTLYAHNSEVLVQSGQGVSRGQRIALVGSTGRSEGDHLHFEVRSGGVPVDPAPWLEPLPAGGS